MRMHTNFSPGASAKGSSASADHVAATADFSGNVATGGLRGSADNPTAGFAAAFAADGGRDL